MTTETTTVTSAPYPNGSLYVGDLRPEVGESEIYEAFKECGQILSVRVCRDVKDQHSLGYAYVNFQAPENAQKALDTLNGKLLKGKPCRVMWSRRDPSQRKSNEGNLFVKGLDSTVSLIQLNDVFSHFGTIASCKVVTRDDGVSLCYGFVQFEKPEDSEKALKAAETDSDQFKSLGAKIVIEKFVPKHLRRDNANETYTNVYVKNICKKFDTNDLVKLFEGFGKITSPVIMKDKDGVSRCFGFVNFENHADAVKAKEALDKKAYKWKDDALVGEVGKDEDVEELKKQGFVVMNLYVDRAQKKRERETTQKFERNLHDKPAPKTNLYIRNLADSVTDEDLRHLFEVFGVIKSSKVMMTPNGISRGFGFCDFATTEAASEAIQKVSGHVFHGKPLYVAHAMKKQDRRAMLESNPRMIPTMGGMYRQQMFAPPNMYMLQMPPNMYPYMRQQMFRQPPYPRSYHRQGQNRRPVSKQQQPPMQQQPAQPQIPTMPAQPPMQQQPIPQPSADVEKQQVGEQIYTRIMGMFEDQALWGKLTGMLLESISLPDLQGLLRNEAALTEKIKQAKEYYDSHVTEVGAQ